MAKFAGRTAILKVGDGVTPTEGFTTVGQVGNIGAFGQQRALIPASSYGDEWMDFVLAQKEGSEVTIMLQYDPTVTEHAGLETDADDGVRRNFQIEFPDVTKTFLVPTVVMGFTRTPALDGLWEAEVTIKIVNPGVSQV